MGNNHSDEMIFQDVCVFTRITNEYIDYAWKKVVKRIGLMRISLIIGYINEINWAIYLYFRRYVVKVFYIYSFISN